MPYNRDGAIKYAQTYWTSPCKDGLLGTAIGHLRIADFRARLHAPEQDGWAALFVRDRSKGIETGVFRKTGETDKQFQGWDGLEDCAHFLSQCLRAGGATIPTEFGVQGLVNALQALPDTKTLGERLGDAAGQQIVDSGVLRPGDMLGYYNNTGGEAKREYSHSAMYVGDNGITCHSICRFRGLGDSSDDEWNLGSGELTYTFIHFSGDDTPPTAVTLNTLVGWWKVDITGKTFFYNVLRNGVAHRSDTPPRNRNAVLPPGGISAYWFQQANQVVFTWKQSGNVDVWTFDNAAKTYRVTINGMSAKVTKLA
jgi:hypothetical protein